MPLDVVPRAQFLQQHSRFLMFSKPDRWDWLYAQLVDEGYRARELFVGDPRGGSRILDWSSTPASCPTGPRGTVHGPHRGAGERVVERHHAPRQRQQRVALSGWTCVGM